MNLKIILSFLLPNFLRAEYENQTVSLNKQLGILIENEHEIFIMDQPSKVFYSRTYENLCQREILDQIFERVTCFSRDSDRHKQAVYKELIARCEKIWRDELEKLAKLRNTQLDVSKNGTISKVHSREKRAIGLGSLVLFSSLVSNFASAFSVFFSFMSHEKVTKELKLQSQNLEIKMRDNVQVASSLFLESNIAIEQLGLAVCDLTLLKSDQLLQITTINLIRSNIELIENEIFSLSFGDIPKNSDFFEIILQFCLNVESNNHKFCSNLLWAGQIQLNFKGLTIRENMLHALIEIALPRRSENFQKNELFQIYNFGKFSQGGFERVNVPNYVIKSDHDLIYGVEFQKCKNHFCPSSAIFVDESTLCFNDIINNRTTNCHSVKSRPPTCSFKAFKYGFIITASSAEIILNKIQKKPIINDTIVLEETATLICNNAHMKDTIHLLDPRIKFASTTKLYKENFKILKYGDIQNITKVATDRLVTERRFSDLEKSDDRLTINKTEVATLHIIILASAISLISSLITIFLVHNFDSIKKRIVGYRKWLTSKKADFVDERKNKLNSKLMGSERMLRTLLRETAKLQAENRTEVQIEEIPLEIHANGKSQIYPKISE